MEWLEPRLLTTAGLVLDAIGAVVVAYPVIRYADIKQIVREEGIEGNHVGGEREAKHIDSWLLESISPRAVVENRMKLARGVRPGVGLLILGFMLQIAGAWVP